MQYVHSCSLNLRGINLSVDNVSCFWNEDTIREHGRNYITEQQFAYMNKRVFLVSQLIIFFSPIPVCSAP